MFWRIEIVSGFLDATVKELDKQLKGVGKKAKIEALSAYETGLNYAFNKCYPDRFNFNEEDLSEIEKIFKGFYDVGTYVGTQFGPLEVESAREFLLAEIEKRKIKFSRTSCLKEFYDSFGRFWWK